MKTTSCPSLADGQSQGHMGLAGTAVADGDDDLTALDVFTPGQFHHQCLVQRGDGWQVEGVQPIHREETGRAATPRHHALMAVHEFQLSEAQPVLWVVHTLGGALGIQLFVIPEKAGQIQFLQMMLQQERGFAADAALLRT